MHEVSATQTTALFEHHKALGARLVPFAGYMMPIQYPGGILKEHLHTRESAGLFDVSHMGIIWLSAPSYGPLAHALERYLSTDILGLAPGTMRYAQLLTPSGGMRDDLMVVRPDQLSGTTQLMLVVNAACKEEDYAYIREGLPSDVHAHLDSSWALLALQGPRAAHVLARYIPEVEAMPFMSVRSLNFIHGDLSVPMIVSRSGYTGEDGYELAMEARYVENVWDLLLANPEVAPIGLGARDSLRLEAGLCLYGHELSPELSPVEAGLLWSIPKRRRVEGQFLGYERMKNEWEKGTSRKRVGIRFDDRAVVREGASIFAQQEGECVGTVTSGGFSPSLQASIAMGYVASESASPGTTLYARVRNNWCSGRIVALPFVPHNYHRMSS
jgi:aminomethyltransferase